MTNSKDLMKDARKISKSIIDSYIPLFGYLVEDDEE